MKSPSLYLSLAALVLAPVATAQQFQVSAPFSGSNIWSNGVVIVDVDADGDNDVLFANGSSYGNGGSQPQHLYRNNGNGTFTAAHGQLNVANFNAQMVIAEDFDNDGDPDLMYAPEGPFPSTTQRPRMLINDGTGNFTDESTTRLPNITMASFCMCAGDVDDDGDLDVVFTDGATFGGVATRARLYLNNGSGFFTDVTTSNMPNDTYNAQDVTLLDWDNDADIDIALSGKGQNGKRGRLYLNDGTGNFSVVNTLNDVGTGGTYEIDFGDLDNDGDLDGIVQSIAGFNEGWARNDGATVTKTTFPTPNGQDDNEMAALDYDNDGDLDVFVGSLGSTEKAYRNNGGGTFINITAAVIQAQGDSTLDLGFGDVDGDGDYDMVTAQGESGNFTNRLYTNIGQPDTNAPVLLVQHTPAGIGASGTVFHIMIRDAIADDGTIYATTKLDYVLNGSTMGSVDGFHMGTGLFRAVVPTTGATTSVSATWSGTDNLGNSTSYPSVVLGNPWVDLGFALAGVNGLPQLVGTGPLTAGSPGTLALSNARPNATAVLFAGVVNGSLPLLGGTLVPFPGAQIVIPTNGAGAINLNFLWPASIPSGTDVFLQYVIDDPAAIVGVAFSNALKATAQ